MRNESDNNNLFLSYQIVLTWSNSVVVFDYFKPPQPPTFDSKANTITAEVRFLASAFPVTVIIREHMNTLISL